MHYARKLRLHSGANAFRLRATGPSALEFSPRHHWFLFARLVPWGVWGTAANSKAHQGTSRHIVHERHKHNFRYFRLMVDASSCCISFCPSCVLRSPNLLQLVTQCLQDLQVVSNKLKNESRAASDPTLLKRRRKQWHFRKAKGVAFRHSTYRDCSWSDSGLEQ